MGVAEMPLPQGIKAIKKHMSENTNAVKENVETAASQQETTVETSTQTQPEVDYEAELQKKDAEIAKVREEKENYRKGMLKAKGKLPEEDDNSSEEDLDAKIDRKVQERLLATRESQVQAEKDALVMSLAKKNKELALALKNRGQISTSSGQGSNQEKPEGRVDNTLSNDQINALKAKGWDDKKIDEFKKNLKKVNQMPK
jgi:hypothetical protein